MKKPHKLKVARRKNGVRAARIVFRLSPVFRRSGNFTCEVDANMSMPNLSDVQIDREGGINTILAGIGMEELSLAHLLNAEGEKIQMALGTLREGDDPFAAEEIYRVNESARRMVRHAIMSQIVLALKLESLLELSWEEENDPSPRSCEGSPDLC